jgi:transcriptional regulator with XRE-family HTH domain
VSAMERALLADFLRARRAALQPEDVGLSRGSRRRTGGLRREEVAVLAGMSTDYYSRLEQQRGPVPSEQMLAALARALKLNPGEREHLFALAGHSAPRRALRPSPPPPPAPPAPPARWTPTRVRICWSSWPSPARRATRSSSA